jgi:tight adherence protein C
MRRGAVRPDPAEVADLLAVALAAGLPPALALATVTHAADDAVRPALLAAVAPLVGGTGVAGIASALRGVLDDPAGHAVVDALVAADRDGLPSAVVVDRIGTEARRARERRAAADARELPVRMLLPLVGLVLPSYVLLALAPLVAAALASLTHRW